MSPESSKDVDMDVESTRQTPRRTTDAPPSGSWHFVVAFLALGVLGVLGVFGVPGMFRAPAFGTTRCEVADDDVKVRSSKHQQILPGPFPNPPKPPWGRPKPLQN